MRGRERLSGIKEFRERNQKLERGVNQIENLKERYE